MEDAMAALVQRLRNRIMDTDPLKNILSGGLEFKDPQLEGFITEAWYDINEAEPQTTYPIVNFPKTGLLLQGAMLFLLQGRGLLHLRNQISYNDAGFSVNLDDKAGAYAQWLTMQVSSYYSERKDFKRAQIPGFRGVSSPYGRY